MNQEDKEDLQFVAVVMGIFLASIAFIVLFVLGIVYVSTLI